jgi:hypothetical protein
MGFFKNKNQSEEPVSQEPSAYEIGLNGTVEEFYAALEAAKEDAKAAQAAYEAYDKKKTFFSMEKWCSLRDANSAAQNRCSQMPYQFHEGAIAAFRQNRPENIQAILADPEKFHREYEDSDTFLIRAFFQLLTDTSVPEAVPAPALAKIAADKRQYILNVALFKLIDEYKNIENTVSALIKAGADAGYESSAPLAIALHKGTPDKVVDMLIENGATLDAALQRMQDNRDFYGPTLEKIETLRYKAETDAKIRELEETIAQLTEAKKTDLKEPTADPSAAKEKPAVPKPGNYDHLKLSNL